MTRSARHLAAAIALAIAGLVTGCVEPAKAPKAAPPAAPPTATAPAEVPTESAMAASAPAAPAAVPGSEVPRAAIAAETRLRALKSLAGRTRETDEIAAAAPSVLASVEALKEWTRSRDPRQQTSRALRSLRQEWLVDGESLRSWMETTGRRLDALAAARAETDGIEAIWAETETKLVESGAPPEILDRVRGVRGSARDVAARLRSRIDEVLLLQSRISSASLDVEDALDSIGVALREERRTLLRIESPPIWEVFGRESDRVPLTEEFGALRGENTRAIRQYAERAGRNLRFQLLLFVVLLITFHRLRPRVHAWPRDHKGLLMCARVVERPLLGAWLVALIVGPWIHPRAPLAFYELSTLLLVVPVVAIMRGVVEARVRGALYAMAGIFVAERLWESARAGSSLERLLLLGLTVISGAVLGWTVWPRASFSGNLSQRWWRVVTVSGRLGLVALAIAFLANVVGNVTLARLLTGTAVRAAYAAVLMYAAALLLRGTVALVLQSPAARSFRTIERHGQLILRRISLAIDAAAVFLFVFATLAAAGFWSVVSETVGDVLVKPWGIGDFRFSFASALVFLAAIYASIFASRAIRAVLEDDVYTRVTLPRGVSGTVTNLTRYSVITIGFLLAAAIAGIPLDRLAIVLGAFSVGIGFGLQTVVNNFVSGLILMFERPIQIGDAVEVGGLVGHVRTIGVRASTIETFDGAEVVVPNGTLVSNQLINWTLSSRRRRIEIQVGVAYGTDPERVLALLKGAVKGQPGSLAEPEPTAVFRGFGASSLDFSLLFWTADYEGWPKVRSDVAVRVNAALREAGIEIPFPQTDVHLRP